MSFVFETTLGGDPWHPRVEFVRMRPTYSGGRYPGVEMQFRVAPHVSVHLLQAVSAGVLGEQRWKLTPRDMSAFAGRLQETLRRAILEGMLWPNADWELIPSDSWSAYLGLDGQREFANTHLNEPTSPDHTVDAMRYAWRMLRPVDRVGEMFLTIEPMLCDRDPGPPSASLGSPEWERRSKMAEETTAVMMDVLLENGHEVSLRGKVRICHEGRVVFVVSPMTGQLHMTSDRSARWLNVHDAILVSMFKTGKFWMHERHDEGQLSCDPVLPPLQPLPPLPRYARDSYARYWTPSILPSEFDPEDV